MPKRPRTTARLDQKLLTLGSAAAAGVSLPHKAEALVMLPSGIVVNSSIVTADITVLRIWLNVTDISNPITVAQGYGNSRGWKFYAQSVSSGFQVSIDGNPNTTDGTATYSYLFLSAFYSESQTFDLNTFSDASFTDSANLFAPTTSNNTWFVALRRTNTGGLTGTLNGWAQLQFGSVTHLQSAFNFDNPSSIAIGQIPEPTSTLLLAAGTTGLLTARRRRKSAA
ncbi:MAG: PEP-CTERM sorting domain-containing protein [Verrucomicrobiota bacterium]